MDYIKQKHHRLTHIIKNCKSTQAQLISLKKTLQHESYFDPLNRYPIKPEKSVSLLKSSRIHIEQFEKRQAKIASFQSKGNFKMRDEMLAAEIEKEEINEKQRKFKKITVCNIGHTNQGRERGQQSSHKKTQPVTPQTSKQKPVKNYLPNIESAYLQTFSPKNASLSQYTLAVKQLQRSVHKKQHQERCKKYNKQNIMRDYQNRRQTNEQKIEMYRLSILKKISCENVNKYLFNKIQTKESIASIEREQRALYRSYHERA